MNILLIFGELKEMYIGLIKVPDFCSFEGFKLGSEKHTTEVILQKSGVLKLSSGIEGLSVLKTTKVKKLNIFLNELLDALQSLPFT